MDNELTKEEAQELLRRYRLGACTQREIEIIHQWYYSFDDKQDGKTYTPDERDLYDIKTEMIQRINERIDKEEAFVSQPLAKQRFLHLRYISRVAAVLLVGVSAAIFFYATDWRFGDRPEVSSLSERDAALSHMAWTAAPKVLYLSDGTVVWLKGDSKLEYPVSFSGSSREVQLTGEAFFDVAPNPKKPFIIHASNFTTHVVGTSFNIKAYRNDESQEVVVVTGKVVVSLNESSTTKPKTLVLRPNEKAVYSRKDNSLTSVVEAGAIAGTLKRSKLAFDETFLENIVKILNVHYNVNIVLEDEAMKGCMVTANLTRETLEVSIAILAKAINATYTINGSDITLNGKGCGVHP